MGGGTIQLAATDNQNKYLSGTESVSLLESPYDSKKGYARSSTIQNTSKIGYENPEMSHFKAVYRRHTNFSIEEVEQIDLAGIPSNGGGTLTYTISKSDGDLLRGLTLNVTLPAVTSLTKCNYAGYTNNTGHAFIKSVDLQIGGTSIDKHYGIWLDVWNELTDHDESEHDMLNKHQTKKYLLSSGMHHLIRDSNNKVTNIRKQSMLENDLNLSIPLKFWFCRNPKLALPLVALSNHNITVIVETRGLKELVNSDVTQANVTGNPTVNLVGSFILLDTDEKNRLKNNSLEYLIEQVQYNGTGTSMTTPIDLNFNHPVKELIWVVQQNASSTEKTAYTSVTDGYDVLGMGDIDTFSGNHYGSTHTQGNDYFNYDGDGTNSYFYNSQIHNDAFTECKFTFDSTDRFAFTKAITFRKRYPKEAGHRVPTKHVYCYSFALNPEDHQPSGTCNFTKINTCKIKFNGVQSTSSKLHMFGVNYNVLELKDGEATLKFTT